jgi:uncharacterized protein YbaA (DUF1428 family)
MERTTESSIEIESGRSYIDLSFSRAPKKNHDALAQLGKQYVQWLKKHDVKAEIYHLSGSSKRSEEAPAEGIESIAKILSIGDEEEVWVALQFYRDQAHADQVTAEMMQDESIGALMKEFGGLISQGSNLIMGGFSRLKA